MLRNRGLAYAAAFSYGDGTLLVGATPAPVTGCNRPGALKVAVRRLTETQYRHTVADVLGPQIKIEARFEPEKREEGLLAIGSSQLSLTSAGFEQYFARGIDCQTGPRRRAARAYRALQASRSH